MSNTADTLIKVKDTTSYREKLSALEAARYDDKLKLIDGCDPYQIESKKWSTDVGLLPPVQYYDVQHYLLYTTSAYTKEDLQAYKGLDAYNQFINGWVRERCAIVCGGNTVVSAKVMHSQRLSETPLRPWLICSKDGKILGAHCNCMAGLGEACTHIAALLYAIEATVKIRDSKTVTEEKAYWLLPSALKKVSYKEIKDIDFTAAKTAKRNFRSALEEEACDTVTLKTPTPRTPVPRTPASKVRDNKVPEASDEDIDQLLKTLAEAGSKAAILSITEPYCDKFVPKAISQDFPAVLSDLKNDKCLEMNYFELVEHCKQMNLKCSKEQSCAVEFATREQRNNKLWHQFRAGRITASRARQVCVTSKAAPSQSLIKSICYPGVANVETPAIKWGKDNESVAKEQFISAMEALHDNFRVEDVGLVISEDKQFIGASPDGIVTCDCCGQATLEIKCPYSCRDNVLQDLDYLVVNDCVKTLKKDHDYFYQIQTQLGCTGMERAYFVVWTAVDIHVEEIEFCQVTWDKICAESEILFKTAILPELVGKFYSRPSKVLQSTSLNTTVNNNDNSKNVAEDESFCYCEQGEFGTMICCDNNACSIGWFHYPCVNVESKPKGKWYCPDCRKLQQFSRCGKKRKCTV